MLISHADKIKGNSLKTKQNELHRVDVASLIPAVSATLDIHEYPDSLKTDRIHNKGAKMKNHSFQQ